MLLSLSKSRRAESTVFISPAILTETTHDLEIISDEKQSARVTNKTSNAESPCYTLAKPELQQGAGSFIR